MTGISISLPAYSIEDNIAGKYVNIQADFIFFMYVYNCDPRPGWVTVYGIHSPGWVVGIWPPGIGLYFLNKSDDIVIGNAQG